MAVRRTPQAVTVVLLAALAAATLGEETPSAFRSRELRPRLFDPAIQAPTDISVGDHGVLRSRLVVVDLAALQATQPTDANGNNRPALLLNVFDDLAYNAEVDRVDMAEDGFTWVGHVAGYDLSTVTLACVNGVVAGSIVMPEAVFAIRYAGNGTHEIAQIDQASFPTELAPISIEPGPGAPTGGLDNSALPAGASLHAGAAVDVTTPGSIGVVNINPGTGASVGAASDSPGNGGAGNVMTPGSIPVVNIHLRASASVDATNVRPGSLEIRVNPMKAESQAARPETVRPVEVEVDRAPVVERRAVPLGSSADSEPGRFIWQPAQRVMGGFNPGSAGGDAAAVRAPEVAGRSMRTVIETPASGVEVSSPFVLAGWSVDLSSTIGAGVDSVYAWAFPVDSHAPNAGQAQGCPDPGATAIALGAAAPGSQPPEGSRRSRSAFANASYRLDVSSLVPGTYDVVVCPHRTSTGQFEGARTVRVIVR